MFGGGHPENWNLVPFEGDAAPYYDVSEVGESSLWG